MWMSVRVCWFIHRCRSRRSWRSAWGICNRVSPTLTHTHAHTFVHTQASCIAKNRFINNFLRGTPSGAIMMCVSSGAYVCVSDCARVFLRAFIRFLFCLFAFPYARVIARACFYVRLFVSYSAYLLFRRATLETRKQVTCYSFFLIPINKKYRLLGVHQLFPFSLMWESVYPLYPFLSGV